MKTFLILIAFTCGSLLAQQGGNGCDANSNPREATVNVSTNTATTLVAGQGGTAIIHICTVSFSTATATSFGMQGSDGTALWTNIQNVATFSSPWTPGTLTTRRAAAGAAFQIVFATAPASPVGVFVTYYITQN